MKRTGVGVHRRYVIFHVRREFGVVLDRGARVVERAVEDPKFVSANSVFPDCSSAQEFLDNRSFRTLSVFAKLAFGGTVHQDIRALTQPQRTMAQPGFFGETNWSTVLTAKAADEDVRLAAMERLLTRYRRPILLEFQSRVRCAEPEAEELAQEFIFICLRRDFLKNVGPEKGRFRSFIKACIANFLRDRHRERATQPEAVSLDETDDEGTRRFDPPAESDHPETGLDDQWARQVVALALKQLEEECMAARRGALFAGLKPFLHGEPDGDGYAPLAARLGMNEGALRTATHRMRQRLGELIEEEIKQTVGNGQDWREELRYLLELLGRNSRVT